MESDRLLRNPARFPNAAPLKNLLLFHIKARCEEDLAGTCESWGSAASPRDEEISLKYERKPVRCWERNSAEKS